MAACEALCTRQDWATTSEAAWAEVVARMPLFAELDKRRLRKATRHAEVAAFAPGDVVLFAGARADFFYVVLGGEAELRDATPPRRLGRGDYFGETALLDDGRRSATVVATRELRVMRLRGDVFLQVVERSPRVAVTMVKELHGRALRNERHTLRTAA